MYGGRVDVYSLDRVASYMHVYSKITPIQQLPDTINHTIEWFSMLIIIS